MKLAITTNDGVVSEECSVYEIESTSDSIALKFSSMLGCWRSKGTTAIKVDGINDDLMTITLEDVTFSIDYHGVEVLSILLNLLAPSIGFKKLEEV